jgi:hypothetical protein
MFDSHKILDRMKDAVTNDDNASLTNCVSEYLIDSCESSAEYMSDDFFSGLVDIIGSNMYHLMSKSCCLLVLLECDLANLSPSPGPAHI